MQRKVLGQLPDRAVPVDPSLAFAESAWRERVGRKVRAHLRRMEPVVLNTPRWSRPQAFLEEIALDLAVGRPTVVCRTVSFRPLQGRPVADAWRYTLAVLAQLSTVHWAEARAPFVADRKGFRHVALELLLRAQDRPDHPAALLAHGIEHLPLSVVGDLVEVWHLHGIHVREDRRTTVLLAGSLGLPSAGDLGGHEVVLADYGEAEAVAALVGRLGARPRSQLEAAVQFTGGMPEALEAIAARGRALGALPETTSGLLRCLGPLADEVRGAVGIAAAQPELADRLDSLRGGLPAPTVQDVDGALERAGLVRCFRDQGEDLTRLRAPAVGSLLI